MVWYANSCAHNSSPMHAVECATFHTTHSTMLWSNWLHFSIKCCFRWPVCQILVWLTYCWVNTSLQTTQSHELEAQSIMSRCTVLMKHKELSANYMHAWQKVLIQQYVAVISASHFNTQSFINIRSASPNTEITTDTIRKGQANTQKSAGCKIFSK